MPDEDKKKTVDIDTSGPDQCYNRYPEEEKRKEAEVENEESNEQELRNR